MSDQDDRQSNDDPDSQSDRQENENERKQENSNEPREGSLDHQEDKQVSQLKCEMDVSGESINRKMSDRGSSRYSEGDRESQRARCDSHSSQGSRQNRRDEDPRGDRSRQGSRQSSRQGSHQGDEQLSQQMSQMNVDGESSTAPNRYLLNNYRPQPNRGLYREIRNGAIIKPQDRNAPIGGAYNLFAPINKKELPYNGQKFAERPKIMMQEKKIGIKTELYTNHAIVKLPERKLLVRQYNIEVFKMGRPVTKREVASELFWKIYMRNRSSFPPLGMFVFNDVNMMWVSHEVGSWNNGAAEGRLYCDPSNRRLPYLEYKYTSVIEFCEEAMRTEESALLSMLMDTIATARARAPMNMDFTVFKRLTFLVRHDPVEPSFDDIALFKKMEYGADARVGFSIAIRLNLRAGPTACFDLNHTLFDRPGYPLVRLLVELCRGDVISDEEYERDYDELIRFAIINEINRNRMHEVLDGMTLHYSLKPRFSVEAHKIPFTAPTGPSNRAVKWEKDFKYYLLGNSADRHYFDLEEDGRGPRRMTIAEYYRDKYNYALRYPNLPVVEKKPSARARMSVVYPMELVSFIMKPKRTEGFSLQKQKADIAMHTTYTANQRRIILQHVMAQRGIAGSRPVIDNDEVHLRQFGLEFGKEMLKCKGTVLPTPRILYGNSSVIDENHTGEWDAVRNVPMRTVLEGSVKSKVSIGGAPPKKKRVLGSMIIIESPNFRGQQMEYNSDAYNWLMRALEKAGQPVYWLDKTTMIPGIHYKFHYEQTKDQPGYLWHALQHIRDTCPKADTEDEVIVPIVFLIFRTRCSYFPQFQINDYNVAKYLGDNVEGIYTQGMLVDTFNKIMENPSVCPVTCHLVEKILGKLGTVHRRIDRKCMKPWHTLTNHESPTLVLGIDVSHPKVCRDNVKKLNQRDRYRDDSDVTQLSVATVVGNIDFDCNEFRASSRIQEKGQEVIVKMEAEIEQRICDFVNSTGRRPEHIVVYRDGITEGDFQRILYEEKQSIERAYSSVFKNKEFTLTYIVVSKRHHTKFFVKDPKPDAPNENVIPGTLIEDVVTTHKYFDFFLASQVGDQGTVKPTHYYVLHDTWAPMDSMWQMITHCFTYSFCRTTSSIGLPAPVMYAHLAAKRARESLDGVNVRDRMDGHTVNLNTVQEINRLTREIAVNKKIEGMPFV